MKVNRVLSMVLVQDMDRALRFYRDTLGFAVQLEEEDWAIFAENVVVMLSPEPLPTDDLSLNSVVITLSVDDVHSAYLELIERGVAFMVGPTDVGGAIVASFRDSEGNILQLVDSGTSS